MTIPTLSTTVNTGKQVFEVKVAQLWKSLDPRDRGRTVQVHAIERIRVRVINWKTRRASRVYLQDFVRRFELMKDCVVDPERQVQEKLQ